MPTFDDLAKDYASAIRQAASTVTKSASAQTQRQKIQKQVLDVISDLDTYVHSNTKTPLTDDDKKKILETLDQHLGAQKGTMWMIKKGSIEMGLQFEQYLSSLIQQIEFEE